MASMVWSWHTVVEIKVATVGSMDSSCDAPLWELSSSILGDLPAVRDLAISWNPGKWHLWFGSWVFLLSGCQLWTASRQGWAERKSEGVLFLLQEAPSSLTLTRAMVAVANLEVSQIAREYSLQRLLYGWVHFHPSWVFQFCGTLCITSCFWRAGRISWLICR